MGKGAFWRAPIPQDHIFFLDDPESQEFALFLRALEVASIIGLDAEWKPQVNGNHVPRVSILQVACRSLHSFQIDEEISKKRRYYDVEIESNCSIDGTSMKTEEFHVERCGKTDLEKPVKDIIFILDMLLLPAVSFAEPLKRALRSMKTVKLGFRLKQDLQKLASSFSGADAQACFVKAEPCIDVGKLYHQMGGMLGGLSQLCYEVLGVPLCKDMQCSDWEQRPLTKEQIEYAAADAYCLLAIFDLLSQEVLMKKNKDDQPIVAKDDCLFETAPNRSILNVIFALFDRSTRWLSLGVSSTTKSQNHGYLKPIYAIRQSFSGTILTMINTIFRRSRSSKPPAVQTVENAMSLVVQEFGEVVVLHKDNNIRVRKRNRGSQHALKNGHSDTGHGKEGIPPWDLSVGGDGIPKFLCDIMVEGLARQLRCAGIDTACPHGRAPSSRSLVEQAEREQRVLLTRDIKLLRQRLIPANMAYLVKGLKKQEQLTEIIKSFNLTILEDQLLSRCIKCNGEFLEKRLTKEEALASAPFSKGLNKESVKEDLEFWQCSKCRHIYWQGIQFHRAMEQFSVVAKWDPTSDI